MKVHALKVQRNLNCVLKQQTNSRWGTSNKPKPSFRGVICNTIAPNPESNIVDHFDSKKKYKSQVKMRFFVSYRLFIAFPLLTTSEHMDGQNET
jgi:hypothetical protein